VPDPTASEVKIAIAKLEKYKPPGGVQIRVELIQAGCETLLRFTNSLILFGIRKNCLINEGVYHYTNLKKRAIKVTVIIMSGSHCYQSTA
jgi:hypothetical protein